MARSTCDPHAEVPKGMMKFEVIRSTIRDNIGQYCRPGDMAILNKQTAKYYLDQNFIKVALPDFDVDDQDDDTDAEDGEDAAERAAPPSYTRKRSPKRSARATAD